MPPPVSAPRTVPSATETPFEAFQNARIWRGLLDRADQQALLTELRAVLHQAPPARPITPWGRPMSVAMTSAGRCGWITDRSGYRYASRQPASGAPWPPIPPGALAVWRAIAAYPEDPECCLINYYGAEARMGLHRDADEADLDAPVISISLGDPARFRVGGLGRRDPTRATTLHSGDVVALTGASRLAYHGIDRIRFGAGDLLPEKGRFNLTLRVVGAD